MPMSISEQLLGSHFTQVILLMFEMKMKFEMKMAQFHF